MFLVGDSGQNIPPSGPAAQLRKCPGDDTWGLRDALDVGNDESERSHAYEVGRLTWQGYRSLRYSGRETLDDHGKGFNSYQRFTAQHLSPGVDTCITKRIDARVRNQVSEWYADGTPVGPASTAELAPPFGWADVTIEIPGVLIRSSEITIEEKVLKSEFDVNCFRIEIYQREVAERPKSP